MKTAGKFALCVVIPLLLAGFRPAALDQAQPQQQQPELLPPPRPVGDPVQGRKIFFEGGVSKRDPKDTCCNCCSCHQGSHPLLKEDLRRFTDEQLFNAIKKGVCEVSCAQVQIPPGQVEAGAIGGAVGAAIAGGGPGGVAGALGSSQAEGPGAPPPRIPRIVPASAVLYTSGDRAFVYCDDVRGLRLPNMGRHMRSFNRDLTDDQIRDLVAYLRTREAKDQVGCAEGNKGNKK